MRVFSVGPDGRFTEYERLPFEADLVESELEGWLEANPDGDSRRRPGSDHRASGPNRPRRSIDLRGRGRVEASQPHAAGGGRRDTTGPESLRDLVEKL